MVDLVDVLVEERACVHGPMHPVVPGILQNEEDRNLVRHLPWAREWNRGRHSEKLAHRVEEPDLRKFDGEMREENEERALQLLPCRRDLVLREVSICKIGQLLGGHTC